MTNYARVADGGVAELFTPPDGFTIEQCFAAGLTWVDVTNVTPPPQPGWSATETNGAWSYAAPGASPPPSLAEQAGGAMLAGLSITLSGSMTLPATVFPTDPTTQTKIAAVVTGLVATGGFPGGGSSYPMKDASSAWHSFSEAQYKSVAGAMLTYAAALDLIIDGNPTNASGLPAASVSLTV